MSWRVHLLPFLEEQALYQKFHLDEPWDSEHNKTLIGQMPAVYRNPSSPSPPEKANYLVPVGKDSMFEGNEGLRIARITDGTANTIMVLELNSEAAVDWTKPQDLQFDADNPLAGLGAAHPGGFSAAFADGSVHFITNTINPETFRRLLMKSDGQAVDGF